MSFEQVIITERYINIIKEINKNNNSKYVHTRFNLLVKYILNNKLNTYSIGDSYFTNIHTNDPTPFIINTNLFDELNELNINFNHYKLVDMIQELRNEYYADIKEEEDFRSLMDDGQIIERNKKMLDEFIENHGYNPFHNNLDMIKENDMNNMSDMSDMSDNDMNDETEDIKDNKTEDIRDIRDNKTEVEKIIKVEKVDQNGSLESLNKILEIVSINFSDIIKDIKNSTNDIEEIKTLIDSSLKLKDTIDNEIKSESFKSILKLANYYQMGSKLHKSPFKANLLYLYLVRKYNIPEAMYLLGDALIGGDGIMKNHSQGTKLIKIAAEDYKYSKAITKLKALHRQTIKYKNCLSESEDED
jgi:hypothetical protein